jgi:hypothetical protein
MQPPSEANGPRLLSDEDVQRYRLDKVTPHNAPIALADYNPDWPVLFAREAARIRAALGSRAVQVEHVGSTSVPGVSLQRRPLDQVACAITAGLLQLCVRHGLDSRHNLGMGRRGSGRQRGRAHGWSHRKIRLLNG